MRRALLLCLLSTSALADESRVLTHTIPDEAAYDRFSRVVGADQFGKFLIDVSNDDIYYFDVNVYHMHDDFVFAQFYHRKMTNADIPEYNRNYLAQKPRFILGYLTHHLKTDIWTYSFWEDDQIQPDQIRHVLKRLNETFFKKNMPWRPDSPMQEQKLPLVKDIPTITNDKIYKSAPYQSFNNGQAVGKLRVIATGTKLEDLIFDRDDIVILQEAYPDIAPVAGIISTVFSTPLSHVNLRAHEWSIPNAGYKDAIKDYAKLDGKMVFLEVRDIDHTLREATADEIKAYQERRAKAKVVEVPTPDLKTFKCAPLNQMRAKDMVIYGTKAANLGEIVSAHLAGVPVPDGFGIPFAAYADHMKRNKLDAELETILTDPRMATDAEWRKASFDKLKADILAAPINPAVVDEVWGRIQKDLGGAGVFVRSSTNAEDLEGFNGAGLYDTVPNVKTKDQLADAIRTVWASLWNFHAVEERTLYSMDERKVAAGILVQIGVNASAAGVLITKDLYDPEDKRSYTINAKAGLGFRVVGGTTPPEQIIYDTGNFGTRIVSRSDDPTKLVFDEKGGIKEVPNTDQGQVILTEGRAKLLSDTVTRFVPLFDAKTPLDVEWVLEGEKIWIVQARPYVNGE
jgi:hypothetical protein